MQGSNEVQRQQTRKRRGWVYRLGLVLASSAVVVCGGSADDASSVATTEVSPTTIATTTTTVPPTTMVPTTTERSTTTTSTPTTEPETTDSTTDVFSGSPHEDLYEVINLAASIGWSGIALPQPDTACFDEAVEALPSAARTAEQELVADPTTWFAIDREVGFALAGAYTGCADIDQIRFLMAIGITNSMDAGQCTSDVWADEIDAATVRTSIVLGLRDLPPAVVDSMVGDAAACMEEDEDWWSVDIALELDGPDSYSGEQAACLGERYIAAFGIEHALRRRVLTLPILTLSDAELAVLDPAACGADVTLPSMLVGSAVGECLAHVLHEGETIELVPCDSPHNGEIVAVLDLSEVVGEWPGIQAIETTVEDACMAVVEELAVDHPEIGAVWGYPTRDVWERGARLSSCIVGKRDGSDWTAPSGIVPVL